MRTNAHWFRGNSVCLFISSRQLLSLGGICIPTQYWQNSNMLYRRFNSRCHTQILYRRKIENALRAPKRQDSNIQKKQPQRILRWPIQSKTGTVLIIRIWPISMKATCRLGFCPVSTFNELRPNTMMTSLCWSHTIPHSLIPSFQNSFRINITYVLRAV